MLHSSETMMIVLSLLLVVLLSANLGSAHHHHSLPEPGVCGVNLADRILGGNKTAINGYPWLTLLIAQPVNKTTVANSCGAALISEHFLLTAAHCFREPSQQYVITKVRFVHCHDHRCLDNPVDVDIESHVSHADYDGKDYHNDIALIKVNKPVTFTEYISPVCLPLADDLKSAPLAGRNFTVVGLGATKRGQQAPGVFGNQFKLEIVVPGVEQEKCKESYTKLWESEMCAGGEAGKDSCQGDSGGFLGTSESDGYWYMYGVVSRGRGCGGPGIPGVYARVTSFLDWIRQHMK